MSGIGSTPTVGTPSPTSATSTQTGGNGSPSGGLTEQNFVQLLVAQLQNQNPTAPTNPQDLANEFSDMAMVSGITSLSQEASQIQTGAAPGQLAQAAGLIGKTVAVPGNTLTPSVAGVAQGAFSLTSAAARANVSVFDTAGTLVGSIPIATPTTGLNTFQWSGGTAGESYRFAISAANASGAPVRATTYSAANVSAIDLSQSAPVVSLAGTPSPVPLSDVAGLLGG